MKNLGPKSSEWLASIGVHSLEDVARPGVVETYKRVKAVIRRNDAEYAPGTSSCVAGYSLERIAAGY